MKIIGWVATFQRPRGVGGGGGREEERDGLARTPLFPFHARSSRSLAPKFPLFSDRFQTAWQVD